MKIYKVTYRYQEASEGFYYTSSLKDAKTNDRNPDNHDVTDFEKKIEIINVTPSKKGIIAALNSHSSHNDNG